MKPKMKKGKSIFDEILQEAKREAKALKADRSQLDSANLSGRRRNQVVLADSSDADIEKDLDANRNPYDSAEEIALLKKKRLCICLLAMLIFAGPIAIMILSIPIDYSDFAVYPKEVSEH